uniref:MADF domain-containing protein n=2 Tax=Caenorhabditis japonica TaxID=281687 RepID=A0A8R1ERS9_CAEJA
GSKLFFSFLPDSDSPRGMSDGPRHATDDFQIGGLKSAMAGASASSATRSADDLQSQYTRDEAQAKETQYTLLQLVSMVRENPILYDEELQSTIPEAQLKKQKREAWIRIRGDMMWQNMTPVQDVWSELLDQYLRKSDELSDSIIEAMRWTDSAIDKKKSDSRPPSQLNNMASSLEKDFFAEVPMTEDVLVSGQTMEGPASINIMRDYVVIQPTRRIGEMESPNNGAASQYSRRKSPESRETE